MDLKKGKSLVEIARKTIETWVRDGRKFSPKGYPPEFDEKMGVFTTLHTYPGNELRGCIGYPEPVLPLIDALVDSAISATADPRFPRLSEAELKNVVVEVSVLTPPEIIRVRKPEEYLSKIEVGKDGLIIESGFCRGLLLPQVPVEWGWDCRTFLENLCRKAGLSAEKWLSPEAKIYRFHSEIFSESMPGGPVNKQSMKKE